MTKGIYPRPSVEERFWGKVTILENGCWEWTGALVNGYGIFWHNPKVIKAHRFAYQLFKGDIPHSFEPDHLCRNRRCVNPSHLEMVTHQENILRGDILKAIKVRQLERTHCPKGHPYVESNTYITPSDGGRICRICARENQWKRRHNGQPRN